MILPLLQYDYCHYNYGLSLAVIGNVTCHQIGTTFMTSERLKFDKM